MIRFESVGKKYKSVAALENVSFEVNSGDIFGYIGPNGAGKTTSIRILVGLIREFEGRVSVCGIDSRKNPDKIQCLIGYMPQNTGFQEWRTVDHALKTFGTLTGLSALELSRRIPEVLETVGMSDMRSRKIAHLSGGMVQKLLLAQALIHKPQILILDEPLSGLDPTSRYQLKNTIREIARNDTVIFFSSHILHDVEDIATKIGILKDGRIMKTGTPRELCEEFQIGHVVEVAAQEDLKAFSREFDFIDRVSRRGNNRIAFHLTSDTDLREAKRAILKKIVAADIDLRSFSTAQPSLEDVYLHYVQGGNKC